jgi:hypothetical protein
MGNMETFTPVVDKETTLAAEYRQEIARTALLRRHDPVKLAADPDYLREFPKRARLMEKIWINAAHEALCALNTNRDNTHKILLLRPGVDHRQVDAVGREPNADEVYLRMRLFAFVVRNVTAYPNYNPNRPERLLMAAQEGVISGNNQTPFQKITNGAPTALLALANNIRKNSYDL